MVIITNFTLSRTLEKNDKRYVGELQIWWYKHLAGGGAFLLGVLLIWGPLFIFSGSSPFLKESASQGVTLTTDLATPWTSFQLTLTSTNLVSMYNNDDATRDSLGDRDSETPLGRRTVLIKRQRRVGEAVQKVNFGLTPSIDFSPPPGLVSQLLKDTNPADGVKYGLLHPTAGIPYTGMFSMKAQFSNSSDGLTYNTAARQFGAVNMEGMMQTLAHVYYMDRSTGQRMYNHTQYLLPGQTMRPANRLFLMQEIFSDIVTIPAAPSSPFALSPVHRDVLLLLACDGTSMWWNSQFVRADKKCLAANGVDFKAGGDVAGIGMELTTGAINQILINCTSSQGLASQTTEDAPLMNEFLLVSHPVADGIFASASFNLTGLYIGVVLAVASGVRGALKGISQRIVFEEMEVCTKPITICINVARAREARDFKLEHDLYLYLIELFRQPQKLYHATTRPEPRENKLWVAESLPENRRPEIKLEDYHPKPSRDMVNAAIKTAHQET